LISNWSTKFGHVKKTFPTSLFGRLLKNVWIEFMFLYALTPHHKRGKTKHH
jgi:hypothetical protein